MRVTGDDDGRFRGRKGTGLEAAATMGCGSSPGDRVSPSDALLGVEQPSTACCSSSWDGLVDHGERFVGSREFQRW